MPYLHGTVIPLDYILSQLIQSTLQILCIYDLLWYGIEDYSWGLSRKYLFFFPSFPLHLISISLSVEEEKPRASTLRSLAYPPYICSILIPNFLLKVLWYLILKNI